MKILVVRNDKLGDFVLALPALTLLKKSFPAAEITVFVPSYTASVAVLSGVVDNVLIDRGDSIAGLIPQFKNFDAVICLYSSKRVAWASFRAKVSYRLAPATKWWQFLYNHRLTQRRSKSLKPEFAYNIDLVKYFLKSQNVAIQKIVPPCLQVKPENIQKNNNVILIHPGSGGSANNLSLSQYAVLADGIYQKNKSIKIVLSAGPGEEEIAQQLSQKISAPHKIYESTDGLESYINTLANVYLFVGGSTGPLHLAGALNIKTAGFYPNKRSATALRWQTLNEAHQRLAFSPEGDSDDMAQVDIGKAITKIYSEFLSG